MTAKTAMTRRAAAMTEKKPCLVLVRLESEAEELDTHDLFVEAEEDENTRREAMIVQLKERVAAGTYVPNVQLIAERILADR